MINPTASLTSMNSSYSFGAPVLVKDCMNFPVFCIRPDDTFDAVRVLVESTFCRDFVVVEGQDRPVGLLTQDQILVTFAELSSPTSEIRHRGDHLEEFSVSVSAVRIKALVKDIMLESFPMADAETPLMEAASLMMQENLSLLPIVSRHRLVGILQLNDLIRALVRDYRST